MVKLVGFSLVLFLSGCEFSFRDLSGQSARDDRDTYYGNDLSKWRVKRHGSFCSELSFESDRDRVPYHSQDCSVPSGDVYKAFLRVGTLNDNKTLEIVFDKMSDGTYPVVVETKFRRWTESSSEERTGECKKLEGRTENIYHCTLAHGMYPGSRYSLVSIEAENEKCKGRSFYQAGRSIYRSSSCSNVAEEAIPVYVGNHEVFPIVETN